MTRYKYIVFVDVPAMERKTFIWSCRNIGSDHEIGRVMWYGAWRQYCFFPADGCVFSAGCLADIQDFIKQAMADRLTIRRARGPR